MALHKPVVSPDGNLLAFIVPSLEIHIISLAEVRTGSRVIKRIIVPKSARSFLSNVQILKWSPETMLPQDDDANTASNVIFGTTWLLLSDGNRVVALSTELSESGLTADDTYRGNEAPANILADFELGSQYGKITFVDFVFSHRHALILFETGSHASVISLTKFQRDDVLNPKFPDSKSFAQSQSGRYFSLLTRSNGQDYVSIFAPSDDTLDQAVTFNPKTLDAQGMRWSPSGQPLLVVWDSATYGFKLSFFTALGHHLRQLDLTSPPIDLQAASPFGDDLGVTKLDWLQRRGRTFLAVACGQTRALIYEQQSQATAPILLASYRHPEIVEPSLYPVWQESFTSGRMFTQPTNAFEALPNDKSLGVELIGVNVDCSMIATKDGTRPKTLWIWQTPSTIPHAVLSFRENVKQILWHPFLANVLVVVTNQKDPTIYVWHDWTHAPAIGSIPAAAAAAKGTYKFEGSWLPNQFADRYLFMMSSSEAFDIGFVEGKDSDVFFESILWHDFHGGEPSELTSDG